MKRIMGVYILILTNFFLLMGCMNQSAYVDKQTSMYMLI